MRVQFEFRETQDPVGEPTREFRITRDGQRDVTGAVWFPASASKLGSLVCFGHGASGDRYQLPAARLSTH